MGWKNPARQPHQGTVTPKRSRWTVRATTWARAAWAGKYLVEESTPRSIPLSPENKIIWATGPLTGTMASTGGSRTPSPGR